MKQVLFILSCICIVNCIYAQDADCKVLSDSLKGTYTGDCKSGKANGHGKAVGIHTYEGDFKNGLPEGIGKYTWSNGDFYQGGWKKGLKDGKGILQYIKDGKEVTVSGYWKKGNYRGEYENPYVITNTTTDIGRVQIENMNANESSVSITVEAMATNASLNRSTFATSVVMTSHQVTRGQFMSKSSNALPNKEITVFRNIVFPFRCTFTFGTSIVEIEFFDKGAWDVVIPINK